MANFTTVSGSKIQDLSGTLLAAGRIYFKPVDQNGNPISFKAGGGGQVMSRAKSALVVNGAFSISLADVSLTSPAYVGYKVTVKDTSTGEVVVGNAPVGTKSGYEYFQPTGSTYNFDNFVPTIGGGTPMSGNSVTGNLTVTGNIIVGGSIAADITGNAATATKSSVKDKGYYNFVTDGGVDDTGATDISTAAQALIDAHPGSRLVFPSGTYKISNTIQVKGNGTWIECSAKGGISSGQAHFIVDAGVCAFEFQNANTQGARFHGAYATGSEPFTPATAATYVLPSGWGGTSAADFIRCSAHGCDFSDNLIEKMGRDGIRIDTVSAGNANCCRVAFNRIINCRGNGIYSAGVDSNACHIYGNDMTSNQLWGGHDASFLGNAWGPNHTDLNHVDLTTPVGVFTVTNSARTANVVTLTTSAAHGLTVFDLVRVTGTGSGTFNSVGGIPQFTVLSVPSSTTFTYYMVGTDKVSGADTGTVDKYPGASAWKQTISGSSITAAGTTLTTSAPMFGAQHLKCLIMIPGAGAAGVDYIGRITVFTSSTQVTVSPAVSTTVSNVSSILSVDGGPYKAVGAAQQQMTLLGNYAEGSQPYNKFGTNVLNILGDNGAGTDYTDGSFGLSVGGGILRWDLGSAMHYRTGNVNQSITIVHRPGSSSNQSTIHIWQNIAGTELFRQTVGTNSWNTIDVNGRTFIGWAPTASLFYSGGGECRLGSDSVTARTGFRSSNVEVAGVESTGKVFSKSSMEVQGANGELWTRGQATELLTLSTSGTTTDTSANLLPANSVIESVVARVTTTITTATDWKLGDPTTAGRFSAANSTMTAGTTQVGTVHADQTGAAGPRQTSAAKVRVTTTGTPGAGVVRITVFYRTFTAPTS